MSLRRIRGALLIAACALVWPATSWSADPITLVYENGAPTQVSHADGVIHLTKGPGWVRVPKLLTDFTLSVRFRALTPATDAGVVVRTWARDRGWPARGYRVAFSQAGQQRELLTAYRAKAKQLVHRADPEWKPAGEWQTLSVSCSSSFVHISVNGVPVSTFEIEDRAGEVFFTVKEGEVELRDVSMEELPTAIEMANAKKAGFQLPRVVKAMKPDYTRGAMQRKIQGTVLMELLVLADGAVGGVSVTRSLDPELDLQAVEAGRQWKFTPGLLNERPVPVIVTLELTFTLGR